MRLYNLFPLLAGPFENWPLHLLRAPEMGFRSRSGRVTISNR